MPSFLHAIIQQVSLHVEKSAIKAGYWQHQIGDNFLFFLTDLTHRDQKMPGISGCFTSICFPISGLTLNSNMISMRLQVHVPSSNITCVCHLNYDT